ncbi:MAG: TFIIB-type zinc ribbon-containing protein [Chitinispirillaceae bacterium]|nr:TFIIB-type zinc ribbon-containing protein [Chitinispirillaceae bacterium]
MICPKCGNSEFVPNRYFCSKCGFLLSATNESTPLSGGIPVETENDNIIISLFSTFKELLLHPNKFFKKVATTTPTSIFPAIIVLLVSEGISTLAAWGWPYILSEYYSDPLLLLTYLFPQSNEGKNLSPYFFIFLPILTIVQMSISVIGVKIVMGLLRGKKASFAQIFRILSYANGPKILSIIPPFGITIGNIFCFYTFLTGLHYLYSESRTKIFFLFLLAGFLLISGLFFLLVAALIGGFIAFGGLKESNLLLDLLRFLR